MIKKRKKTIKDFNKIFNHSIKTQKMFTKVPTEILINTLYYCKGYFNKDNSSISKTLNKIIKEFNLLNEKK